MSQVTPIPLWEFILPGGKREGSFRCLRQRVSGKCSGQNHQNPHQQRFAFNNLKWTHSANMVMFGV